ncbi:hypothetical protein GA0070614_0253 [Micromonospora coxensis]|uniref:Uncharacterized protein n=1 Tax=Micromonospora coxensis TaxID=356852 RepID=A0A1C5GQY9_9ACTN|nr:hypothetical protein GA0070614_0253 [Micromonospora coxensis]
MLSVVLLVGWLLWAVSAWWASPRQVDVAWLDRDLAAGRVSGWDRAQGWIDDGVFLGGIAQARTDRHGATIVWTTPGGQTRAVDLGADGTGPGSRLDGYTTRLTAVRPPGVDPGGPAPVLAVAVSVLAMAVGLVWLVALVTGPPPRHGTRWFWFWLGLLPPFGLGVLAWLYAECWRPPTGRIDRHSGLLGLAWGFAVGLVLSVVTIGLRAALGGNVVPGG